MANVCEYTVTITRPRHDLLGHPLPARELFKTAFIDQHDEAFQSLVRELCAIACVR